MKQRDMKKTALWNRESTQRDLDLMKYYLTWPTPSQEKDTAWPWQWQTRKERQEALANERWTGGRWPAGTDTLN